MTEEQKKQFDKDREEVKKQFGEFNEALKATREIAEKSSQESSELKTMLEKTKPVFEKFDGLVEKVKKNSEFLEQEKKATEERVSELENIIAKKSEENPMDYRETSEYKALETYMRVGNDKMTQEQKNLLRSDLNESGGYLVQPEIENELLRKITEYSDFRVFAKVRSISSQSTLMPTQGNLLEAEYEGEAVEVKETTASFGSETVSVHRLGLSIPVTNELLNDASFNVEAYILQEASEAFARKEAYKFIYGTGEKQPEGIIHNAKVIARRKTSIAAGSISSDDLTILVGSLQSAFTRGRLFFNQDTLTKIRLLKDKNDRPLWQMDMTKADPTAINGLPYSLAPEMPVIAANSIPIFYGDLSMGYEILDREGINIVRDIYTDARKSIIRITIIKRNTGRVLRPEAFTPLQIKA